MINNVTLVGRLTRDPELKYTQSGLAVTRFTLAVERSFAGQDGKKETDFIDCVLWRKQAENAAKYLSKGSLAGGTGRLQISSFDDKEGNRRTRAEVVLDTVKFLDSKGSGEKKSDSNTDDTDPFFAGLGASVNVSDDDLPF